ncbi:MAG: phosphate acyltransferase PlsX [Mucinivorans sp.]
MRIGIDAMGGDYAPRVVVQGAIEALEHLSKDSVIVLFGDQKAIETIIPNDFKQSSQLEIVHCSQVIEMGDHPSKAFKEKSDSSITKGFGSLGRGQIDGFASAGSTGAMMVGSMFVVGAIDGVMRPTICTPIATTIGTPVVLLDAGLNSDCKAEVLLQYAVLGNIYARDVVGIAQPRVALLNIGEEPEKGNLLTKAAYQLFKESQKFTFVGNVEGKHLFDGSVADVIVCDGFAGNTILKQTEGIYAILRAQGVSCPWIDKLDYQKVGGTPVLGIRGTVIIGHGHSSALAIKNMILATERTIAASLVDTFTRAFSEQI